MKTLLHCLPYPLLATLLFSCSSKDNAKPARLRVASVEETNYPPISSIPPSTSIYTFKYDREGRISAVNDREFSYRNDGKVAFSRIHRSGTNSVGIISEYIEKLRYEWDNYGRLSTVTADSIYHHHYGGSGGTFPTQFESFSTGAVIAKYEYNGTAKLPVSIEYLTGFDVARQSINRETLYLEYEGGNVTHTRMPVITSLPIDAGTNSIPSQTIVHTWYRYTDKPHYLYDIYQQAGFHPYNFGAVVTANNPASIYDEVLQSESMVSTPDWSKAEMFETEYNASGYPTQIRSAKRGIVIRYY